MNALIMRLQSAISYTKRLSVKSWVWYRAQKNWKQVALAVLLAVIVIGGVTLIRSLGAPKDADSELRTVTLATAGSLSGVGDGSSVIGSVRSIAEADILAESGGTVRSVRTQQGATVPAGYIIAELENASQRAVVLQAEGVYDAAVAARSSVSPTDASATARNAYQSAYAAIDYALENQIDSFYGNPGPYGPKFLLKEGRFSQSYFPQKRDAIKGQMESWRVHLASSSTEDPEVLLAEATTVVSSVNELLTSIAEVANSTDSNVSATQLSNLATVRSAVNTQASTLASAREAYRNKSVGSSASVNASVKQALGSLRGAQAQLEKTLVRAPIGGTVNFLPIRVGDYVTAYTHVATVAQNGSLEVLTYVSEDESTQIAVGEKVKVDAKYTGIITSIAPALDPSTRQIEVHVAITDRETTLVNGQSVRMTLPGGVSTSVVAGPLMLPLASVKLRTNDRVVFTVNEEGRLVEHVVTVGQVRGNRIEILNGISSDARIVTDARGLSSGQKVAIAESAVN